MYRNLRYLKEQVQSEAEILFNGTKQLIERFNGLTPEQKQSVISNAATSGKEFHEKVAEILQMFSDIDGFSADSQAYITTNKDEIVKSLNELKSIVSKNNDFYNNAYKEQFDIILSHSAYKDGTIGPESTPSGTTSGSTAATGGAAAAGTTAATGTTASTDSTEYKPNEEVAKETFKQFMVGDYDPNSRMDAGKMGVVISAMEEFKNKNGREYDPSKDRSEMQSIMNKAYSSPEYASAKKGMVSGPRQIGISGEKASQKENVPIFQYGDSKYEPYVDMGGGRYVKATPEQIADPNLQLYIRNPKKGQSEYGKPNFVKMRRERGGKDIRPQSQFGGALGSLSNLGGDVGRSFKNFVSSKNNTEKENEEDDDLPSTADRAPARMQARDNSPSYLRNPNLLKRI